MIGKRLLKTPVGIVAVAARRDGEVLVIEGFGVGSSECPDCGTVSTFNKGVYSRRLQDLPIQGRAVRLEILLRRWRCRNGECARQSFVERLEKSAPPHARRTRRVSELGRWIGHATGGRTAERILRRLGIAQSDDTVLRLLKRDARNQKQARLRVVGIDDWSWQRGSSYGTIMVDLERRQVIDVLEDRSAEAVAQWLARHPRVKIVSRVAVACTRRRH
jgi:transposase